MATKLTIKKTRTPMTLRPKIGGGEAEDQAEASSGSGVVINERLRLDTPPADAKPTVGRKAAQVALYAGLLGLGLSVGLTFLLYKHWEYLMPW